MSNVDEIIEQLKRKKTTQQLQHHNNNNKSLIILRFMFNIFDEYYVGFQGS